MVVHVPSAEPVVKIKSPENTVAHPPKLKKASNPDQFNGVPEIDARKGTNKIKQHAFRKKLHQVQTDTVEDRNSSVPSFKVAMKTARDDLLSLQSPRCLKEIQVQERT